MKKLHLLFVAHILRCCNPRKYIVILSLQSDLNSCLTFCHFAANSFKSNTISTSSKRNKFVKLSDLIGVDLTACTWFGWSAINGTDFGSFDVDSFKLTVPSLVVDIWSPNICNAQSNKIAKVLFPLNFILFLSRLSSLNAHNLLFKKLEIFFYTNKFDSNTKLVMESFDLQQLNKNTGIFGFNVNCFWTQFRFSLFHLYISIVFFSKSYCCSAPRRWCFLLSLSNLRTENKLKQKFKKRFVSRLVDETNE